MNRLWILALLSIIGLSANAQISISGKVKDNATSEPVFGAAVLVKGSNKGVSTDFDGIFKIDVASVPVTIQISFIGYFTEEVVVTDPSKDINVRLKTNEIMIDAAEIVGERISEKQKQEALTIESMDLIAIKEAPTGNFYEGLGNLKGVDLTSASLGFKVINTRGFNSTSPVRSLQLIDGVDNQSPGLNFSLGNFLGSSDLDVLKVDIIAGASSAFYGPGAFNGVINMTTKDPFVFPGLSASVKVGERALNEYAVRWADYITNEEGFKRFGYKLNVFYLNAKDWEADNYNPIFGSEHGLENPFGFDAVNIYGDEPIAVNNDYSDSPFDYTGLGTFYRNGYREADLTDYSTENLKFNAAAFYNFNDSIQASYSFNFGYGTTVYQGDNRYRLKDVNFFQNKLEVGKPGKWFLRTYTTKEDAGNTYDIVTTAIRMQEAAGPTDEWNLRLASNWSNILGYTDFVQEQPRYDEILQQVINSGLAPDEQLVFFNDLLQQWYVDDYQFFSGLYQQASDATNAQSSNFLDPFYEVGTARYDSLFNSVTSRKFTDGGSRFFDRSALYHVQGEYKFDNKFADFVSGFSARLYRPDSEGTIFRDTLSYTYLADSLDEQGARIRIDSIENKIKNSEFGIYLGAEKRMMEDKLKANATLRMDKNQNFDYLFSPALSLVYTKNPSNVFRFSFSSAIRNPTLADQYLFYNVGRAILLGNIDGQFEAGKDSLFTLESFNNYRNTSPLSEGLSKLEYFNVNRIRPEKVRTFELGYRATWFENTYFDLGYYYSVYNDFIGYVIGLSADFNEFNGFPEGGIQAYRIAANAAEVVSTQGFSIGSNYYFRKTTLSGNYSWNQLLSGEDDPIIPAFNTPKHKFNLGISARDLTLFKKIKHFGYGINYKWIDGFLFEGSPQFTGNIDTYDMLDAQVNVLVPRIKCTFKLGGSNLFGLRPLFRNEFGNFGDRVQRSFENNNIQVYGGPAVGRMLYIQVLFDLQKRQ